MRGGLTKLATNRNHRFHSSRAPAHKLSGKERINHFAPSMSVIGIRSHERRKMLRSIKCKLNISTMIYLLKKACEHAELFISVWSILVTHQLTKESLLIKPCRWVCSFCSRSVSENQLKLMHFIHVSMTFIVNFQLRQRAKTFFFAKQTFELIHEEEKKSESWDCFSTRQCDIRLRPHEVMCIVSEGLEINFLQYL